MSTEQPFLYFEGLKRLSTMLSGNERIHIGIRPYGYHAGNDIALVVYPVLLCRYVEELGKTAKFTFIYSINDMEQDSLDGPDYRKYPFNIFPQNTSLQYTKTEESNQPITDYWQPKIEKRVRTNLAVFPNVNISFIRNSSLKNNAFFKQILLATLRFPHQQFDIYKKHSKNEALGGAIQYTGAICKKCESSRDLTHASHDEQIFFQCFKCNQKSRGSYEDFDYWLYHKPLLIARLKIFEVDVTLSGGDHFHEGDFEMRSALIDALSPEVKKPIMAFTPTILSFNGEKMSKSRNNTKSVDIDKFVQYVDNNYMKEITILDELCT